MIRTKLAKNVAIFGILLVERICLLFQGPFATFNLPTAEPQVELTGIKFSNDGKKFIVSTTAGTVHLLDAFQGNLLHTFTVRITLFVCLVMIFVCPMHSPHQSIALKTTVAVLHYHRQCLSDLLLTGGWR